MGSLESRTVKSEREYSTRLLHPSSFLPPTHIKGGGNVKEGRKTDLFMQEVAKFVSLLWEGH